MMSLTDVEKVVEKATKEGFQHLILQLIAILSFSRMQHISNY